VRRIRSNRNLLQKQDFPLLAGFRSKVAAQRLLLAAVLSAYPLAAATPASELPTPSPVQSAVSLNDYRSKLQSLDQIVASCQRATIPANCQSDQVGPDLQLSLPAGVRQIRFAWLRDLLNRAAKGQAAKEKPAKSTDASSLSGSPPGSGAKPGAPTQAQLKPEFTPPTLIQQLEDARQRLATDSRSAAQQQAAASFKAAANPAGSTSRERQTLAQILAAKEYHPAVAGPSLRQRLLEKIGNWLDRILGGLQRAGFRSKWIGRAAEIGFIILLCVALAWLFIRLERQGRLSAASIGSGPASDAASARDWQLWLEDARTAASQGAWRDAIHLLYWASISRLESNGLWPADRARTPREYLALVSPENAQRTGLDKLTHSFERTWYGGRPAAEADFRNAEQFAAELGAKFHRNKGAQ